MVVAPANVDPRPYYRQARRLYEDMSRALPQMDTLSMGMSLDYPVAIEEGATMVRIGEALFACGCVSGGRHGCSLAVFVPRQKARFYFIHR